MTPNAIDDTAKAEEQFNWLARTAEAGYDATNGIDKSKLIGIINSAPVYLLSHDKAQASLKYFQTSGRSGYLGYHEKTYPVIIADDESCVLITNVYIDVTGRAMIEAMLTSYGEVIEGTKGIFYSYGMAIDALPLSTETTSYWDYHSLTTHMLFVDKNGKVGEGVDCNAYIKQNNDEDLELKQRRDCINHIRTAIEQYLYILSKKYILVKKEADDKKILKKCGNSRVARHHQREIHKLIDPDVITEKHISVKTPNPLHTHASPAPHIRSGYVRTFKHPRFKHKLNQSIKIAPVYVNCKPGDNITIARKVYHVVSIPS